MLSSSVASSLFHLASQYGADMRRRKSHDEQAAEDVPATDPLAAVRLRELVDVGHLARGKPDVRTREVVAMQRTVGNKAAGSVLVQRDKKDTPKTTSKYMLHIGEFEIPLESMAFPTPPPTKQTDRESNERPVQVHATATMGDWGAKFYAQAIEGRGFKAAVVTFPGGRLEMENVFVTEVQVSESGGEAAPKIAFTLDAAKGDLKHTESDSGPTTD